ncbi:hypothetical protein NP233_g3828 [Leucocoprinus birnbaumii]|uniref:Transmembrane protein n=1 Tax=Leucocoprinus birnbaumii TaxID=56174 RepID=A0AAD5VWB7_9AGAR|nr:hypothetical protein NP233_g3828 [Leucocoprinus birnbaumii]
MDYLIVIRDYDSIEAVTGSQDCPVAQAPVVQDQRAGRLNCNVDPQKPFDHHGSSRQVGAPAHYISAYTTSIPYPRDFPPRKKRSRIVAVARPIASACQSPQLSNAAELSAILCQTLPYGIYLATCFPCCRTVFFVGSGREERWRHLNEVHWMMATIGLALFAILTFDLTISWLEIFQAFVNSDDAVAVFMEIRSWIKLAQIYRCWIVHGRRWIIIVPSIIIYLTNMAVVGRVLENLAASSPHAQGTLNEGTVRTWILVFYATVAIQNALTTSILVWRIWRVDKERMKYISRSASSLDRDHYPYRLRGVIRVIAESGAIYTTSVVATLISTAASSKVFYPLSCITFDLTGIAFNMILIRTSPRRDQHFTTFDGQTDLSTIRACSGQHQTVESLGGSILDIRKSSKQQEIELTGTRSWSNPGINHKTSKDVSLSLVHNFQAFVESDDATAVLLDLTNWTNIAQSVDQATAMILCDFVLIYRCWIVCGRRWIAVVPSITIFLANLAITGTFAEAMFTLSPGDQGTFTSGSLRSWSLAFFGTIATQNILTTSIIIWRIWRIEKENVGSLSSGYDWPPRRHLRRFIRVIAESGAMYTTCIIAAFISNAVESNAFYPISDTTIQMTGIAFNMILIRASPNRDQEFSTYDLPELTTYQVGSEYQTAHNIGGSTLSIQGQNRT